MVQLGMQLGANQMIDYSKKFGFGQPTGIELPGEESGILYRPEDMYEPDIATMAIGQGIAVTPLQMLRAICAIANGGELLEPYIIDKIVMPDGRVLRQGQAPGAEEGCAPRYYRRRCRADAHDDGKSSQRGRR